jgi:hypothetical protein
MDLFKHTQSILRWIRSSDTAEQLDLLQAFITGYVVPRFEKVIEETKDSPKKKELTFDLEAAKTEMYSEINNRKIILASGKITIE